MKRILTVLMSAIMVLSMMPAMAFAEGEIVAEKNGVSYDSLTSAIADATDGETVKLLENVTYSRAVCFDIDKTLTIDLNGKTIEAIANGSTSCGYSKTHFISVKSGGNLTITDSSEGKSGIIKATYGANSQMFVVDVLKGGSFTFNGGRIENSADTNYGSATVYIRDGGNFILDGGTVAAVAAKKRSFPVWNAGTMKMKDGQITSNDSSSEGITQSSTQPLEINGGSINTACNKCIYVSQGKAVPLISNGQFSGAIDVNWIAEGKCGAYNGTRTIVGNTSPEEFIASINNTLYYTSEETGADNAIKSLARGNTLVLKKSPSEGVKTNNSFSSGKFTVVLENDAIFDSGSINVASGYKVVSSTINDTTTEYSVVVDENQAQARINDTYYTTLGNANANAKDGDTIVVMKDITGLTSAISITKNITIDLNGHLIQGKKAVTSLDKAGAVIKAYTDQAKLRIIDSSDSKTGSIENTATSGRAAYADKGSVSIEAGNYSASTSAVGASEGAELVVKGGTFSTDPTAYVPEGSLVVEGDNVWTVRARKSAELKSDIGEKTFTEGDSNWTEFTFSTVANDDKGKQVYGTSNFSAPEAIEALQYYEVKDGNWYDLPGNNFGSASGFPMSDATSTFRVKFKAGAAGNYEFTASMKTVDGDKILCELKVPFEVKALTPVTPPTPEPEDPITNTGSGDNASTNVDASDNTTTTESGKTETAIDSTLGDKIVENAKENNVADVVIKAETEKGDSTGSTVALPESTVQALAKDTEASVTIKTDSAEVSLDKAAVDAVAAQAGTDGEVKLVVETVENTEDTLKVELKLVTSKGTVTDFQGGNVTVTVPVSEELAGKKLVCVYIDDNDKYIMMDGSLAADGKTFTFTTGHFSTYAILSEEEAKAAIDGQDISKASVSGIANKTYTGKAVTQKLTVKAGDKALVEGTDYTVSYSKNVNVGVARVKITGKGKYEGTLTKTFKINPKGTSISKVTGQKKAIKVVWKKQLTKMKSSYVSGYQVQYSTSSKFTSGTSKYANAKFSKGRTTKTIKNLKSGKKYYVRVRTYKSVDGTKCYSSWSKTKSVKTK